MALALALGFGDVLAQRGRLVCNLLVLDEVSMLGPVSSLACFTRRAHAEPHLCSAAENLGAPEPHHSSAADTHGCDSLKRFVCSYAFQLVGSILGP